MGNIVLLDDLTINKIAAGEVIERPASAVKELVENSIDAGATNITIEIKNGGISYIRITDNGKGILPDDMEIAFERHATSKIRVAQDIETVKSMGFRGEALASIAAIAKVTMKSKTEQNEIGSQIIIEGGKVIEKEEIGCPNGTSITIENLFFNTPVRYKFLKKDFTEAGYIEDVITRIALAHPEISIKYINTGKTVISTSGNGDIKTVIYAIYGKDIAENVVDINYEYEDIKVNGVVGKPEIARSNRANQLFFVNRRYIKDKILTVASMEAFKNLIPVGKYGFLVLNIELNPAKVDVNVHPAKLEVRFQEEQNVYKAVYNAMRNALGEFDNIRQDVPKQTNNWSMETRYRGYGTVPSYIENGINAGKNVSNGIERNFGYKESWNKIGAENIAINEVQSEENEKQKGLFKRFLNKKEKEEEPTIVEQLYQARKQENSANYGSMDNFNGIMKKMAEMQKSVREFNESQGNIAKEGKRFAENEIEGCEDSNVLNNQQSGGKEGKISAEEWASQEKKISANQWGEHEKEIDVKEETIQSSNENYGIKSVQTDEAGVASTLVQADEQTNRTSYERTETQVGKLDYGEKAEQVNKHNYKSIISQIAELNYVENSAQTNKKGYEQTVTKVDEFNYGEKAEQTSKKGYEPTIAQLGELNYGKNAVQAIKSDNEATSAQIKEVGSVQEATANIVNVQQEPLEKCITDNKQENVTNNQKNNFEEMYATIFGTKLKNTEKTQVNEEPETYTIPKTQEITSENLSLFEPTSESNTPKYKYIGTAFNNFILIELDKELYILDQTAANEKIIYEDLKQKYENKEEKDTQLMLLPDVINLTEKQMLVVEDNKDIFEKVGFILEQFGKNTIKLTGAPNICMKLDTEKLFLEILEQINKVARTDRHEIEEKMLTTIASAVATESVPVNTPESVEQIMKKITEQPNDFMRGTEKQVFMRLTKADIEKKFSRR